MTIYVIYMAAVMLIGGYLLGDKITAKQKVNCMMATGLALVLIMSLRFEMGFDYRSYEYIYTHVGPMSFAQIAAEYKLEAGFYFFVKLITLTGLGYQQFLFIFNIILISLLLFTIYEHSSYWWISCTLYVALQFMGTAMNFLRQALALTIIFAGWGLLKKRKVWQFMLVVVLAGTLHVSALIMIPCALVMLLPMKRIILVVLGVLGTVGYIFMDWFVAIGVKIFPKYGAYIGDTIYAGQNDFSFVAGPFIYCLIAFLFMKPLLARDKSNSILLYAAFINFFASLFITRMFILERFAMYFFIFSLILIPEIIAVCKEMYDALPKEEKENRRKKKEPPAHVTALVVLVLLSSWFFYWNAVNGANKAYPYVSIFNPEDAISSNNEYVIMINSRHM